MFHHYFSLLSRLKDVGKMMGQRRPRSSRLCCFICLSTSGSSCVRSPSKGTRLWTELPRMWVASGPSRSVPGGECRYRLVLFRLDIGYRLDTGIKQYIIGYICSGSKFCQCRMVSPWKAGPTQTSQSALHGRSAPVYRTLRSTGGGKMMMMMMMMMM